VFSLDFQRAGPTGEAPAAAALALLSVDGQRIAVLPAHLPPAAQVVDQLRLWHAQVETLEPDGAWPVAAPDVLVLGAMPPAQQQALLARWQRAWPQQPAAVLLMAAADHPAADWPRLVRLSQRLAAHRLRAALIALQSSRRAGGATD
jgi:hypothetical protein